MINLFSSLTIIIITENEPMDEAHHNSIDNLEWKKLSKSFQTKEAYQGPHKCLN